MIQQVTHPDLAQAQTLAQRLFPADVAVAVTDPLAPQPAPLPAETACLSPRAIDKRRREFAAGRAAARLALGKLGHAPAPIAMADDRSPIWPAGLVGSITHTRNCAAAAVAQAPMMRGLGLDVERNTPLKPDLVREICTGTEQDWLARQQESLGLAKLVFSAKEAAYKCQYPLSRQIFGFDGFQTRFNLADGGFSARFTRDAGPFAAGDVIEGRFAISAELILTGAFLRPAHHD